MRHTKQIPNIRLYKLIHDPTTVDNILSIYKALRGKENLEKRLFLKTLIYCAMNKVKPDEIEYTIPEYFFSQYNERYTAPFNLHQLESLFQCSVNFNYSSYFYGNRIKNEFGKLV